MDKTLIILLAIILFIFILLNNITIVTTPVNEQANCSQTAFGCCPDGINSKINFYGTNCPGYRPIPGYPTHHNKPPPPSNQIGGCAGTRYGCCPNKYTPRIDIQGSNCILK